jgi:hypothetical protein
MLLYVTVALSCERCKLYYMMAAAVAALSIQVLLAAALMWQKLYVACHDLAM